MGVSVPWSFLTRPDAKKGLRTRPAEVFILFSAYLKNYIKKQKIKHTQNRRT
jgi:hypothetical protein